MQSPGTIWAPIPPTPPIFVPGSSTAFPITVQNGHLTVNGQRLLLPGVNWDNWAVLNTVDFKSGSEVSALNQNNCNLVLQHLNNCAALGFKAIRIHGLDCFHGGDIFGDTAPKGTLQLDPNCLNALAWFIHQARTIRGFRICVTVHFNRLLLPTDVPTNPPPEFAELMANGYWGVPPGGMWPWVAFSPALQALDAQFEEELFSYVSQYDNLPLGQLVDFVVVRNEQLLGKDVPYSYPSLPVLNGLFNTAYSEACAALGFATPKYDAIEHAQVAAWLDVQLATTACARIKQLCPQALLISNTAFGAMPYSGLPGCWVGDITDLHCYGPFTPPVYPAQRTGFAAMLSGCYKEGMPQSVTEWSNPTAPVAQQSVLYGQVTTDMIDQDGDMHFVYSYASSPIQSEGSPYWKPSIWDQRINSPLLTGVQYWNQQFCAPRGAARLTTTIVRTNGLYGANTPGTNTYTRFGPTNDPALFAVPSGTKIII